MANTSQDSKPIVRHRNRGEQRKWADWETRRFLQVIAVKIKDEPSRFMKPSAEKFLSEVCKAPAIKHLAEVRVQVLRDKLRHQRGTYDKALKLMEDNPEEADEEKIRRVCPNFDVLKKIYGEMRELTLYVPDASDSCEGIDPLHNNDLADNQHTAMSDDHDYWTPLTQPKIEKIIRDVGEDEDMPTTTNGCKCQSVEDYEILVQKLQRQEDLDEQRIQLERDRLQLDRDMFAYTRYIEKYKFDKEMELRRYEIELKYKTGRHIDEEL